MGQNFSDDDIGGNFKTAPFSQSLCQTQILVHLRRVNPSNIQYMPVVNFDTSKHLAHWAGHRLHDPEA